MSKSTICLGWGLLLTLALFVRIGVGLYWDDVVTERANASEAPETISKDGPFFYGDSDSYWKLARALAFGRPYEFDDERHWQIFRTPGYPALLAPLFWIYGEYPPTLAARTTGAFFGMINVALVGWLALVIFGRNKQGRMIAFLASLFVALDPTEALQSVSILSEEPFMTFSLLLDIGIVKASRFFGLLSTEESFSETRPEKPATGSKTFVKRLFVFSATLAVCSAATIYLRPSWYYFVPFSLLVLLAFKLLVDATRRNAEKKYFWTVRNVAALLLCVALAHLFTLILLSPWILRNYRLTGLPITTTLQMGASLYDGLSPEATGASDMTFVDRFRMEELENPSDSPNVHFEARLNSRMKSASIEWTKSHPKEAARLALVKFYRLWAPVPRDPAFSSPFLKFVMAISFTPVFLLGILGAIRAFRLNNAAYFLIVPALYVTALHVVFVSSIRYRVPVMFGFAILGAYWLVAISERRASHNRNSTSHMV